jgi:arsenic resistance protein ArsH
MKAIGPSKFEELTALWVVEWSRVSAQQQRGCSQAQRMFVPVGSRRPTQGGTLAMLEVSGGSQSFNAINKRRLLGRWMRVITILNQSSVAKALIEFDDVGG